MKKSVFAYTIVYSSDDKGILMLGISLYSLMSTAHANTRYRIYILEDNIQIDNQSKVLGLQDIFDCEIHFVPVHDLLGKHVSKKFDQWPATMYARLFLPSLLPQEDLVLYLDIDTLVVHDLSDVFQTDLGQALMGVVYQRQDKISELWKERLHIPKSFSYFNSGVLLMNLAKMRDEGIEAYLLSYLRKYENDVCYPDQDVLNAVLYDRVQGMHPKWNWHASHTRKLLVQYKRMGSRWGNASVTMMEEAICLPCIIHFPGLPKPACWNYHFYGQLYRKVWQRSPWRDVSMSGKKRFSYLFRKMMYVPFDYLVRCKIHGLLQIHGKNG